MFRRADFRFSALLVTLIATAAFIHAPAQAQFRGGFGFLQAVDGRDGTKVTEALKDDASLINAKRPDTGETALIIVAKRRDATWLRFLLGKEADPAIADKQGMTPLMHAALLNFTDGAEELIDARAPVDQTNRRGETALILAVQTKNVAMVRLLMRRGANPNKADHATGMSARDYAKRDDRTGQIIALLDAKADGPTRDLGPSFGPN